MDRCWGISVGRAPKTDGGEPPQTLNLKRGQEKAKLAGRDATIITAADGVKQEHNDGKKVESQRNIPEWIE